MRNPFLGLIAALAACSPQPLVLRPAEARPADLSIELLNMHNRERAAAHVPPLTWDISLSQAATGYARELAAAGTLRHSQRNARPGQGENLWMGTRGAFSVAQMAGSWISEKRFFRPGTFPAVSSTGHWADTGHYSQMIWPTTTRLGCAIASSATEDFLVCRYSPAGNVDGRPVP